MSRSPFAVFCLVFALALGAAPGTAATGSVYKHVGPDGKITYTDRTPGSGEEGQKGELRLASVKRDPAAAVFSPTFFTSRGEIRAGKAFLAQLPNCPTVLLVTALHLFGPAGGFGAQMAPGDIGQSVTRIGLSSIAGSNSIDEFKAVNRTPVRAAPCCQGETPASGVGDVAAFVGPSRRDLALPVSGIPVKRGDRVYVVTSLAGGKGEKVRFEAVARGLERGYLLYDFIDGGYAVRATSGAPVLNANGEVVAINLGGGSTDNSGRMYGLGNPATAWRDALSSSCRS
ncbi:MAG: hypothetical protein M3Z16_08790 [Pseudomonadota bacterium]|nr:hypothetical protein [Pseudomonadota bacterium]